MTDFGLNLLYGAGEVTGLYNFLTGQRILCDARQSYINYHNAHDDHMFTGENRTGESPSWPTIVPFNDGWISLHEIITYGNENPDYSPVVDVRWKVDAISSTGDVLWTKNYSPGDFGLTQITPPDELSLVGNWSSLSAIAGNTNSRVLIKAGTSFRWLNFSSTGDMTVSTAFSSASDFSDSYMCMRQYRSGTGYVVASNADLHATGKLIFCLTADLDLVAGLPTPTASTTFSRQIVNRWNGDNRPHLVELATGGGTGWVARPIIFDGVTAPSFGATVTGDFAIDVLNPDHFAGSSAYMTVDNWTTGAGPKPADHWAPASGPAVVAPNPSNMEWVYGEDWTTGSSRNSTLQLSVVADWYGATGIGSPYSGDRFSYMPSPVRFNIFNEFTKTAAAIDVLPQLPVAPVGDGGGIGIPSYDDFDMDDAGYTIVHPDSGRIFAYVFNYWRILPRVDGGGANCGDNTLLSYWVLDIPFGELAPVTTMPAWWNAFGSSGSAGGGVAPASPDGCARLGQGENVAFLYDRGGSRPIAMLPPADMGLIRWNRKRDDMSNCTMALVSPGSDCCQIIREMQVGRHEIVVFRNGERSWEGPLTRISYKADSVEVEAHDVMHYASRTIMRSAYDNRYRKKGSRIGPVTKRAQNVLQRELARKEALGYNILKFLDVRTHPQTTKTSRYTPAYFSTVYDEMEYMAAKLSLDYTVIGRRIVVSDVHDILGRVQMLTDKDFTDELIVTSYGMELRTRSAVTDGEGNWAAVGGVDPFYGEVEFVDTSYGEEVKPATTSAKPTKAELAAMMKEMASQARRNLTGRYPIPTVVRIPDNTRLSPEAPVTLNELIPGIRVPIRATLACLELQQEQKLDYMQVEQSRDSGESVTITLSPAPGTTPWDDSSETSGEDA